jgi:repressor LexA
MEDRDITYLNKLRDYYAEQRVLPSFSGVAKLVGLRSTSAVAAMVKRLKERGYLDSSPDRRLQPGKRFFERVVQDSVQAGQPQTGNDSVLTSFSIDEYLIESPSRTTLLRVNGDSMIDAGIMSGDMVIVKKGAPASVGDIVVAIVDQEYTVKYLAKDEAGFYLKPGNKEFSSISPADSLELFGVVIGMFRKFEHQSGKVAEIRLRNAAERNDVAAGTPDKI